MSKYSTHIPREVGKGALPEHPAIKTPWEKLISFHDAYHYLCRHIPVIDTVFIQALRILIPDYKERASLLCEVNRKAMAGMFSMPIVKQMNIDNYCIHPFMQGGYIGGVMGDAGDDRQCMPGRVNDFGQYRVEKELDVCPWDILGSEFCRATTASLQGVGEAFGPDTEYNMVEAIGCGDLHCRVIAEDRTKFPMPEKQVWEKFGPIATDDQIKFTPEEQMVVEPMQLREECGYKFSNGLTGELTAAQCYGSTLVHPLGASYVINVLNVKIASGELDPQSVEHMIRCMFEATGKTMFGEFFAIKGLRDWLGVPNDVNDGRVLGGFIEVILQVLLIEYSIINFNENEVIYEFKQAALERRYPLMVPAYLSMWYGMSKTLIGARWSVWREFENVPEDTIRLIISKKIDKFC